MMEDERKVPSDIPAVDTPPQAQPDLRDSPEEKAPRLDDSAATAQVEADPSRDEEKEEEESGEQLQDATKDNDDDAKEDDEAKGAAAAPANTDLRPIDPVLHTEAFDHWDHWLIR